MTSRRSLGQGVATLLAIPAAAIVLAGIVLVTVFLVSTRDKDGDDVADGTVEHVADALADDLRGARDLTDAATVAAEMFHSRSATVEPLTWSGTLSDGGGIVIEARISAVVEESSSGALFAPSTSAGSSERCYRYAVTASGKVAHEEIPCSGIAEPVAPPASTRPELPLDTVERVDRVLAASGGTDPTQALRDEFPDAHVIVQVEQTAGGEWVVAVGVTPGTDCVLRVRRTTGDVVSPPYDRIWLEPGETGCSPALYTAPPR
ncbi:MULTISPECIES: hypothetical protein [unclassified Microbacterium]|uniref:hypothetical protein n=1 Tax=unclassified Microbacterium TaxID=2609290 RepID=UPI001604B5C5|nr:MULTISPECIES: hypothetical protein [unclassified Microbacterium]QNA92867.1 hypothetical protein G4G29_11760 [Microbacterium sp. Se63.02b]QYM63019.1 hypothetical protein K1X59_11815 [Microbacterium sp. Se5.02b]